MYYEGEYVVLERYSHTNDARSLFHVVYDEIFIVRLLGSDIRLWAIVGCINEKTSLGCLLAGVETFGNGAP